MSGQWKKSKSRHPKKKTLVLWRVITTGTIRLNVWFITAVREWPGWRFAEHTA